MPHTHTRLLPKSAGRDWLVGWAGVDWTAVRVRECPFGTDRYGCTLFPTAAVMSVLRCSAACFHFLFYILFFLVLSDCDTLNSVNLARGSFRQAWLSPTPPEEKERKGKGQGKVCAASQPSHGGQTGVGALHCLERTQGPITESGHIFRDDMAAYRPALFGGLKLVFSDSELLFALSKVQALLLSSPAANIFPAIPCKPLESRQRAPSQPGKGV